MEARFKMIIWLLNNEFSKKNNYIIINKYNLTFNYKIFFFLIILKVIKKKKKKKKIKKKEKYNLIFFLESC